MTEQSLLARSIKTILMAGVGSAFLAGPALAQDQENVRTNVFLPGNLLPKVRILPPQI